MSDNRLGNTGKGRPRGSVNKKTIIKQTLDQIKEATGVKNEAELDPLVGLAWAANEAKRLFLLQQSAIEAAAMPKTPIDGEDDGPPSLPMPQMMGIAKDWLGMYVRALEVLAPYMHAKKVEMRHANHDGTGDASVIVRVVATGVPRAPAVGSLPVHGSDGDFIPEAKVVN